MSFEIRRYRDHDAEIWDNFCHDAINATFLHRRKFISYHGDKFHDESVLFYYDGRLVGVMPAARDLTDDQQVVSHPGLSYGGIVHQGWLCGQRMLDAMTDLLLYYKKLSYQRLLYKSLPYGFAIAPAQDDLYALFRLQAQRVRCDLTNILDLSSRRPPSTRRKRAISQAKKHVELVMGHECLPEFWPIVIDNLWRKHKLKPVHNLSEIMMLIDRFPNNIVFLGAKINGKIEAGLILFNSVKVWHSQYSCASEIGNSYSAMDLLLENAIAEATESGVRYFDFGISTDQAGMNINNGLFQYKYEFGGGAMVHETYKLSLEDRQ